MLLCYCCLVLLWSRLVVRLCCRGVALLFWCFDVLQSWHVVVMCWCFVVALWLCGLAVVVSMRCCGFVLLLKCRLLCCVAGLK